MPKKKFDLSKLAPSKGDFSKHMQPRPRPKNNSNNASPFFKPGTGIVRRGGVFFNKSEITFRF